MTDLRFHRIDLVLPDFDSGWKKALDRVRDRAIGNDSLQRECDDSAYRARTAVDSLVRTRGRLEAIEPSSYRDRTAAARAFLASLRTEGCTVVAVDGVDIVGFSTTSLIACMALNPVELREALLRDRRLAGRDNLYRLQVPTDTAKSLRRDFGIQGETSVGHYTEAERARMVNLVKSGMTYAEIGRELGRTRISVKNAMSGLSVERAETPGRSNNRASIGQKQMIVRLAAEEGELQCDLEAGGPE